MKNKIVAVTKILIFLLFFIVYNNSLLAMNNKPYHHLPDGTFRNPEGSPERKATFNWSYKVFNQDYSSKIQKPTKDKTSVLDKFKKLFD